MKWAAVVERGYDLCKMQVTIWNNQFVQQTFVPDQIEGLFDTKPIDFWEVLLVLIYPTTLFNWWNAE
jgi:hypothetical protein